MLIYLDFDGTVVEHVHPKMGRCNFGCFEVIKKLQDAGHEIVLNTYRADIGEDSLAPALRMINQQAFHFLKDRGDRNDFELLPIKAIGKKLDPHRFDLPAAIAVGVLFIDDMAYGTPTKSAVMSLGRMVDWDVLDVEFKKHGLYNKIEKT